MGYLYLGSVVMFTQVCFDSISTVHSPAPCTMPFLYTEPSRVMVTLLGLLTYGVGMGILPVMEDSLLYGVKGALSLVVYGEMGPSISASDVGLLSRLLRLKRESKKATRVKLFNRKFTRIDRRAREIEFRQVLRLNIPSLFSGSLLL